MESLLWWEKDVSVKFNSILSLLKIMSMIIIPAKTLSFLKEPSSTLFFYQFGPVFLILVISLTGYKLKNLSPYSKITYTFGLSELLIQISLISAEYLPNEKAIFTMFSVFILIYFELSFIQSRAISIVVILKFSYQWYFTKVYNGETPFCSFTTPYSFLLASIGLYCISSQNEKENSLITFTSEKLLRKAYQKNELMLGLIPDGFCMISSDLEILECNENLTELLKCSKEKIFNSLEKLFYVDERKTNTMNHENSLAKDLIDSFKWPINDKFSLGVTEIDESRYDWTIKVIKWENEKTILVTVRNIDELVKLEQSLTEISVKNSLLRQVSHELKTPSYAIQSYSEDTRKKYAEELPEGALRNLDIIWTSSKMLLYIINDLLDYSKIISGVFVIQKEYLDPLKLIEECEELVSVHINKKKIELKKRIDPDLPTVIYTDPTRLKQILLNLLSNALKFTINGYIEICVTVVSTNSIKIDVKDTGIGIDADRLNLIFNEFNSDQNKYMNPTGTGLGLFISNILAEELGRYPIEVSSTLGRGSIFCFYIDSQENYENEMEIYRESVESEECLLNETIIGSILVPYEFKTNTDYPATVLIVDDNDFNREILGRILDSHGISYLEAVNGEETLRLTMSQDEKEQSFKVIILDLEMPDMNGVEVSRKILELHKEGELKIFPNIIGYSGAVNEEIEKNCIENGMVSLMSKPSPANEIISNIMMLSG